MLRKTQMMAGGNFMLDKDTLIRLIAEKIRQQQPAFPAERLQQILSAASAEDLQRLMQAMSRFELSDIFHLMGQLDAMEEQTDGN